LSCARFAAYFFTDLRATLLALDHARLRHNLFLLPELSEGKLKASSNASSLLVVARASS
jgi:hypothetical protein